VLIASAVLANVVWDEDTPVFPHPRDVLAERGWKRGLANASDVELGVFGQPANGHGASLAGLWPQRNGLRSPFVDTRRAYESASKPKLRIGQHTRRLRVKEANEMHQVLSLLLPATLLFAGPGERPERSGKRGAKIQQLDTDGSGTLSAAEVEGTRIAEHFSEIDADGDGELSKEELKAARKGRKGKRGKGKRLDKDGNGTLSAAEVEGTRLAEHFSEIDADGDGELSREEMRAAHEARRAERFAEQDTNGDGALSESEVEGSRLARHFSRIDANDDGQLTPDELKAAHDKRKGKRGKGKRKGKRGNR